MPRSELRDRREERGTHQEPVAHEVEHDGGGAAERLVPDCGVVGEVLGGAAGVVGVDDPHLLAEDGLDGDVDGDHDEQARAEKQEELVAPLPAAAPLAAVQDQPDARKVQHELNTCKDYAAVVSM